MGHLVKLKNKMILLTNGFTQMKHLVKLAQKNDVLNQDGQWVLIKWDILLCHY